MTREEAINIIEQRVGQDEALEIAVEVMKNPVAYLTSSELRQAYEKQQHIYDCEDIEDELDMERDYYIDKFGIDKEPVTEDEIERMAKNLRRLLDDDADAVWSCCCSYAVVYVLSCRNEKKERKNNE